MFHDAQSSSHFLTPMMSMPSKKKCHGGQAVDQQGEVGVNDDDELTPENIHEEQMEEQ